jgi:hypothetical protein
VDILDTKEETGNNPTLFMVQSVHKFNVTKCSLINITNNTSTISQNSVCTQTMNKKEVENAYAALNNSLIKWSTSLRFLIFRNATRNRVN